MSEWIGMESFPSPLLVDAGVHECDKKGYENYSCWSPPPILHNNLERQWHLFKIPVAFPRLPSSKQPIRLGRWQIPLMDWYVFVSSYMYGWHSYDWNHTTLKQMDTDATFTLNFNIRATTNNTNTKKNLPRI